MKEQRIKKKARINTIMTVIIFVIAFLCGYILSANFMTVPLSNSELEVYEDIALDVYEYGEETLDKFPNKVLDKISVSKTENKVVVEADGSSQYVGKVVVKEKDGKLVTTKSTNLFYRVYMNILMGLIFVLIIWAVKVYINLRENEKDVQ